MFEAKRSGWGWGLAFFRLLFPFVKKCTVRAYINFTLFIGEKKSLIPLAPAGNLRSATEEKKIVRILNEILFVKEQMGEKWFK